ncbi:MAG: MFS transporter [Oscillospiraceae bacterium]|nr:MFS transporter [Oscillospiraceae bacterium]
MAAQKRSSALIVVEGLFANLMFGSLFVWSILRNPFLALFPTWNEGMLSAIFGIHNLFVCGGILLGGQLCKRIPTRRVFLLFASLMFIGYVGFAFLPVNNPNLSYAMAFILFCVFAATGAGIGINVVQSTTIPWFPKRSGAISGALYMALGISSVIMAAIAQRLLPTLGVKNVMPVFGIIIIVTALVILCDKQSITPPPAVKNEAVSDFGLRPSEMLKTSAFWVLALWNICLRTAGLILLDHTASMAVAFGGAALTAMLIAPANGLGSICVGAAMDKLGSRKIMLSAAVLMTVAGAVMCAGTLTGTFPAIFVGLLIAGFAYGGSSSSYAATVKNRFGNKFYSQTFAVSNLAMGCAALLESTSGSVLDATGSYFSVVLMVFILAAAALILSLFTRRAKL